MRANYFLWGFAKTAINNFLSRNYAPATLTLYWFARRLYAILWINFILLEIYSMELTLVSR